MNQNENVDGKLVSTYRTPMLEYTGNFHVVTYIQVGELDGAKSETTLLENLSPALATQWLCDNPHIDLAAIISRNQEGRPSTHRPMMVVLANDFVRFCKTKDGGKDEFLSDGYYTVKAHGVVRVHKYENGKVNSLLIRVADASYKEMYGTVVEGLINALPVKQEAVVCHVVRDFNGVDHFV